MGAESVDRRSVVVEALRKIDDLTARLEVAERADTEPIAVVGLGCRFPGGVDSPAQYWQLLREGRSGVVRVPAQRWDADVYYSPDHTVPGTICTREGGFLTSWQPDEFDAEFFGISPREAAGMDPQQRLVLEVAWEALENTGVTAQAIRGTRTGVFVGSTANDYTLAFAGRMRPEDADPYLMFGNAPNFAAGRLAYLLGVHGPAVVVDTACSSSLVTLHLACQSLRRGECDRALAGGVNLNLTPQNFIACSRWGMLAPDGRCKTFDAAADGYVRSEGAGVVVLKRLGDALADGDSVWAVVRGSAVNQDGPSSGQTVPSGPAQQAVVRAALAASRLVPADIDYVEAHGTGTALGDPIELDALGAVFRQRDGAAPLVLGSVKTNLGHLESASGVAGFIKTVLGLRHGVIPRHLHFERLTPHAGAGASRLVVAAEEMAWPAAPGRVRRAGVSSFGVSGTNAHVVVEAAPEVAPVARGPEPVVSTVMVSGKSAERVASSAAVLAEWMVGAGASVPLADVAHTLNHHRSRYKTVAAVCARDREQAVAGLRALAEGHVPVGVVAPHRAPVGLGTVFVYSGQGSQWAGMGQRLLAEEPAFAAAIDELEPVFVAQVGFSLQQVLSDGELVTGDARVQPVIMGMQLALTALWRSYGVEPDAVIGHSMGEVAAAVVAGALSPADGLKVIATRSRLMSRLAGQGAVALLELDAEAAEEFIAAYPGVTLTVYSSPRQTVIAGPVDGVDAVIAAVSAQDRFARRVNMEVASHTVQMDSILPELRSALADLAPKQPFIRFISTITDTAAPTLDADYWADNVRQPVRFCQAITTAAEDHATFIEVSPHPTLTNAITETLEATPAGSHSLVSATITRTDDQALAFHTQLATVGITAPEAGGSQLAELPPTPWHHSRHWVAFASPLGPSGSAPRPGTLLGEHISLATAPSAQLWQARLVPENKPYPGRHRIHGVELVPASVLLQTLRAAVAERDVTVLADVRFEHPVVVNQPRLVQVVADGDAITVSSIPETDSPVRRWVRHLTARIGQRSDHTEFSAQDGLDHNGARSDLDLTSVGELHKAWGIEGQPYQWSIISHRSVPGGLAAEVELSAASTIAVLDAALHVARLADASNPVLMFPAGAESVCFESELIDEKACIAVRRRGGDEHELTVDVVVNAPDGTACIDIRGLRFVAAGAGLASTTSGDADPRTLAHVIEWQPRHDTADWQAEFDETGTFAALGQPTAVRILGERLTRAGYRSASVDDARCVLYVADPGSPAETDIDCAVRLSTEVADLVRQLAKRDDSHSASLWIITRGVREAGSEAALRLSCLWGLAGVIRAEQPDLWGGLIDLPAEWDSADDIEASASAMSVVLRRPAKAILSLRDGEFFEPTVAPVSGQAVREPLRCRADAAYLITGGMGALGLLIADWLADRGARRLILAGRTPLPPRRDWDIATISADVRRKIAAIRNLEMRGVSVDAVALDVGSHDAVQALLARRDEDGEPPIRGVVHAAGVAEGQLLTEIEESRLRRTMWPKISGARVLHKVFPPSSLDFFFMTSAAGAVFGVPGQGAYATANAYLDGLARARHRQGCHTLSLDWVAWRGLGFATAAEVVLHELERLGSRPVIPEEAFPAWEYVDTFDIAQAVMIPMPSDAAGTDPDGVAPALAWSEMSPADVLVELESALRIIVAQELHIREVDLDPNLPFAEMGLNSVMAMSIRREAERLLGMELSATMLFNHPTITALTSFLAQKLSPQQEPESVDDLLSDSDSVLNDLFESVESTPAGSERGI